MESIIEKHKKWLLSAKIITKRIYKKEVYGKFSSFFVSSHNYPSLHLGPSLSHKPFNYANLYGKTYDEILPLILSQIYGKTYYTKPPPEHEFKIAAMAIKPFYAEMHLKKPPSKAYLSYSSLPIPPSSQLSKFIEVENAKIPRKVYSLYEEKIKAEIGLKELYVRDYDYYYLQRIFSAGILGEHKKVVPTRWSITAVDDIISQYNKDKLLNMKEIEDIEVYTNYFLGNKFVIILIPGLLAFENFEAWWPKTTPAAKDKIFFTVEREYLKRRREYAKLQLGGYYAVKHIIFEHLARRKRQAKIMVIREIYNDYEIPLGVWQIRENVKHALSKRPFKTNSMTEAMIYASMHLRNNINIYLKKSQILKQKQLTLKHYLIDKNKNI